MHRTRHRTGNARIIFLAVLFWTGSMIRFAIAHELHSFYGNVVHQVLNYGGVSVSISTQIAGQMTGQLAGISRELPVRLGARAKLNGRVVHELLPVASESGQVRLLLPREATGLVEISVAAVDAQNCILASATEEHWLTGQRSVSLTMQLQPLGSPLCG